MVVRGANSARMISRAIREMCIRDRPRAIHPKELAQAISLLLNLWANPFFVPATGEEMQNRAQVLRRPFEGVGLDIIDDEMEATFFRHTARHLSCLLYTSRCV